MHPTTATIDHMGREVPMVYALTSISGLALLMLMGKNVHDDFDLKAGRRSDYGSEYMRKEVF